jgi:hypothetical protein
MGFKFGMVSLKRPKKNLNFPFKLTGDAHKLKVHFRSDKRHPNLDSIFPLVKSVTLVTRITRTTIILYSISDILAQYFALISDQIIVCPLVSWMVFLYHKQCQHVIIEPSMMHDA